MFIDTTSPFNSKLQRSDMFQTMNNQPRGTFRSYGAAENPLSSTIYKHFVPTGLFA